jgi:hypothetical protein
MGSASSQWLAGRSRERRELPWLAAVEEPLNQRKI